MELYKSSFVPTVVDEWNALSTDVRGSDSVRIFKEKIHVSVKNENVLTCRTRPNFFTYGDRFLNIIHTKLRHNCALNNDLFRCNIINSPLCSCGKLEDTYHYFFTCNKYKDARNALSNEIFHIVDLNIVNTHVLLWGDSAIRDNENKHLFTLVYDYIKNSERFNWY